MARYGEVITPYYTKLAEEAASKGLLCFAHDHVAMAGTISIIFLAISMHHHRSEGEAVQASSMDEYVDPVIAHCKEMAAKVVKCNVV